MKYSTEQEAIDVLSTLIKDNWPDAVGVKIYTNYYETSVTPFYKSDLREKSMIKLSGNWCKKAEN